MAVDMVRVVGVVIVDDGVGVGVGNGRGVEKRVVVGRRELCDLGGESPDREVRVWVKVVVGLLLVSAVVAVVVRVARENMARK